MQCECGTRHSAKAKALVFTTALKNCGTCTISEGTLSVEEVPPEAPSRLYWVSWQGFEVLIVGWLQGWLL